MAIELSQNEMSKARLALDEYIVDKLRLYGQWNEDIEQAFSAYQKLRGYFSKETFEALAWKKVAR